MDLSKILTCICRILVLIAYCQVKSQYTASKVPATTRITQITHTEARRTSLLRKKQIKQNIQKHKKTGSKITGPIIKEFPLQPLLEIGLTSNEANKFIRSNYIKGKPLEQQYEKTREADMIAIENKILRDTEKIRKMINAAKQKKKIRK
ncbi:uncharacterized protein LOC130644424 [Hydractinia symbiolongicarpus]|uniref:uncharacterized protein LOC130644424 n=1 Tax=Hydractinia symbiolongicarpus TaxID=13093 RepID=UPI00254FF3D3|nr:uncharacterized protein LOC130644424 [Hydractinia symbiolongicarpus]